MNDFSICQIENCHSAQPTANNFIAPLKRAQSSFSPAIITDKRGNVRLVVGAAGGTQIITTVAMVMYLY